jgi:hypothetical protein
MKALFNSSIAVFDFMPDNKKKYVYNMQPLFDDVTMVQAKPEVIMYIIARLYEKRIYTFQYADFEASDKDI